MPCQNGMEGWGVYPGGGGALLLPLIVGRQQCMCVVCAREKEGRLKGLVPIIL